MIGNDIVDLALARKESNWKRKGFLNKIFTNEEQLLINNAENQNIMVWTLWSMKEAAYKIHNRQTQIRIYNPILFKCFETEFIEGILLGKIVYKGKIYFTKTIIASEFIHTVAVSNFEDFDKIQYLKNSIKYHKNNGIPNIFDFTNSTLIPISISHHGRFERRVVIYINPNLDFSFKNNKASE